MWDSRGVLPSRTCTEDTEFEQGESNVNVQEEIIEKEVIIPIRIGIAEDSSEMNNDSKCRR